MKEFKIRASACSLIMAGTNGMTEKQEELYQKLDKKDDLTDAQQKTFSDLYNKKHNPILPEGAKTYCKNWLKEQIYSRRKEFTSKFTDKGLIKEDNNLDFIADFLEYGMLIKNEDYFENDFLTGTPDVILPDHLIDVKSSWDCFTFPLYETEIDKSYYYQAQVYMKLCDVKSYKLIYVLSDTPEHLIEKEAFWWCKNNGFEELDEEVHQSFVAKMTYPDIKDDLKIKVFNIERSDDDILKIEKRVAECREYIKTLI